MFRIIFTGFTLFFIWGVFSASLSAVFPAVFSLNKISAESQDNSGQTAVGPMELKSLFLRFAPNADALGLSEYNQYYLKTIKHFGNYNKLHKTPEEIVIEGGIIRVNSLFPEKLLGVFGYYRQLAPDFVYLTIITPSGRKYMKTLEGENILYLPEPGQYKISLSDLRYNKKEERLSYVTVDDIIVSMEEVDMVPQKEVWFIDDSVEMILNPIILDEYIRDGGTAIYFIGDGNLRDADYSVESVGGGQKILLAQRLNDFTESKSAYLIGKIKEELDLVPRMRLYKIMLSILMIGGVCAFIYLPVKERIKIHVRKTKKLPQVLARILGIEPFSPLRFIIGTLFFFIIFVLSLFFPEWIVSINSRVDYEDDGSWRNFYQSAEYMALGIPHKDSLIDLDGEFISNSPLYTRIDNPSRTFINQRSMYRAPGIDFQEDFEEVYLSAEAAEKSNSARSDYQIYLKSEIYEKDGVIADASWSFIKDFVIDIESINREQFIKEEIVKGTGLDNIFVDFRPFQGVKSTRIDLYGFNKFGAFLHINSPENEGGRNSLKFEVNVIGDDSLIGGEDIGGLFEVYDIKGGSLVKNGQLNLGSNILNADLGPGTYYLIATTYNSTISNVSVKSLVSLHFALDWRLYGRERNVLSGTCGDNRYALVKMTWASSLVEADGCGVEVFFQKENIITQMFTADIFDVFVDTLLNQSTDLIVTNTVLSPPANSMTYKLSLYDASPGKLEFDTNFSIKNINLDYVTETE